MQPKNFNKLFHHGHPDFQFGFETLKNGLSYRFRFPKLWQSLHVQVVLCKSLLLMSRLGIQVWLRSTSTSCPSCTIEALVAARFVVALMLGKQTSGMSITVSGLLIQESQGENKDFRTPGLQGHGRHAVAWIQVPLYTQIISVRLIPRISKNGVTDRTAWSEIRPILICGLFLYPTSSS